MTSKTQSFHFRVFLENRVVAHYRVIKPSLPAAITAFRKWFGAMAEPGLTYRMTASTATNPDVWEWYSLNTDKRKPRDCPLQ